MADVTDRRAAPAWPHPYGAGDFEVDEVLGFEPTGTARTCCCTWRSAAPTLPGSLHVWQRTAAFAAHDVGYSGLKDRRALTRQWFSVPGGGLERWQNVAGEGYRVLAAHPHTRKLRRGSHRANRFHLTVRELTGPLETSRRDSAQSASSAYRIFSAASALAAISATCSGRATGRNRGAPRASDSSADSRCRLRGASFSTRCSRNASTSELEHAVAG
jgi:hypothetical protein